MKKYIATTGAEIAARVPAGGREYAESGIIYDGKPLYAMNDMPTAGKRSGAQRAILANIRKLGKPAPERIDAVGIRKTPNEIMGFAGIGDGRFVSATKKLQLGPGEAEPAVVFCLCLFDGSAKAVSEDGAAAPLFACNGDRPIAGFDMPDAFTPDEILSAMDMAEAAGDLPGRKIFLRCRSEYYLKGLSLKAARAITGAQFNDYCDIVDARQTEVERLARAAFPDMEARDIMPESELGIIRDSGNWAEAARRLESDKNWKIILTRADIYKCGQLMDISDAKAYTDLALSGAEQVVILKPSCRRYYEMFLTQLRGMELFGVKPAAGSSRAIFPLAGTFAVDGDKADKLYWTDFNGGGDDFVCKSMRAYSPAVRQRFKEFCK